jgi:3-polyprenyl-4-hydroxybenzoate decarboxylase
MSTSTMRKRIIVAVTGATGAPLAISLLKNLRRLDVESHLIMSKWGAATLKYELDPTQNTPSYLQSLTHTTYVSAAISPGSFRTDGMILDCNSGEYPSIIGVSNAPSGSRTETVLIARAKGDFFAVRYKA